MTRFIAAQPDAPDGRPFLVLSWASHVVAGPGGGTTFVTESSHVHLCEAQAALRADAPSAPSAPTA